MLLNCVCGCNVQGLYMLEGGGREVLSPLETDYPITL